MKNPLKFIQDVKQEAFKVTWPTGKETLQGALMVFAMAVIASLFFLLLDQILKFFLELQMLQEKLNYHQVQKWLCQVMMLSLLLN